MRDSIARSGKQERHPAREPAGHHWPGCRLPEISNGRHSNSKLLPGAIADSLTSYGGDFDKRSQTKLTEFLRQGAAGSSGAVTEPFNFPEKFPLPMMHYYYAMGCSLAEAWYQAVASPYQAILVGDPLTRPFADFSTPRLAQPNPDKPWQGEVQLHAESSSSRTNKKLHDWNSG